MAGGLHLRRSTTGDRSFDRTDRGDVHDGWRDGPTFDKHERWAPDEIGAKVTELVAKAPASQKVFGS